MRVEFESFNPDTRIVHVRTSAGSFSAEWMDDRVPEPGDWSYVEFSTEPTGVWGIDVTDASPDEADSITEDATGWTFVGTVLGLHPDGPDHYVLGGRIIPPHDLESGIFYMQIADSQFMMAAEGLPADAAGRRVRVRQTTVELFPE